MKFIKKFAARSFACFAVGLLAVGCSSSAVDEPLAPVDPDDAPVEIVLNGGISLPAADGIACAALASDVSASATRAAVNAKHGELPISILRLDETSSGTYQAYSNGTLLTAKLGAATAEPTNGVGQATGITFIPAQYYLTNGLKTKLIGWHPQVGTATGTSKFVSGVVTCDIDGDTDIMLSDESADGDKGTAISKPLNFKHLLTQIQVSAYAATSDAKDVWGGILDVSVEDEGGKQCEITLPGGAGKVKCEMPSSGSASDLPLIKKDESENVIKGKDGSTAYGPAVGAGTANPLELGVLSGSAKNDKLLGYAMFAPLVPASGTSSVTLTLKITTEKDTKNLPITLNGSTGFEAGKAYQLTLKFTATGIDPQGEITDWVDHEWGTGENDFKGEIEL